MLDRGRDRRAALARSLAVMALSFAPSAFADVFLQGVGDASLGYTDNAQSAPEVPLPEGPSRSPGAYLLLSPGIVLATVSAQAEHRLTYRYEYDLFFADSDATSSVNRLEYHGFFDLTPRLQLLLGAMATESSGYSAITFAPAATAGVSALPEGTAALLQLTTDESLQWDMAPGWRGYEAATFSVQTPLFGTEAPTTLSPTLRLGVERSFEINAVGAEARAEYTTISEGVDLDGAATGTQRQVLTAAVATYRQDFGYLFTGSAEAGVLRVDRLNTGQGHFYPTGAAALDYTTETGAAELSYRHTVTTNVLLGQWSLIDEVRLHGGLPLTRKGELYCAANAAYQRGRLLDSNTEVAAYVNVLLADVSLGMRVNDYLSLALRYQHIDQDSDRRVRSLPISFVRNDILLGASIAFPPERKMPQPYRAPQRVDATDELRGEPVPAEPVPRSPATQPG